MHMHKNIPMHKNMYMHKNMHMYKNMHTHKNIHMQKNPYFSYKYTHCTISDLWKLLENMHIFML